MAFVFLFILGICAAVEHETGEPSAVSAFWTCVGVFVLFTVLKWLYT